MLDADGIDDDGSRVHKNRLRCTYITEGVRPHTLPAAASLHQTFISDVRQEQ